MTQPAESLFTPLFMALICHKCILLSAIPWFPTRLTWNDTEWREIVFNRKTGFDNQYKSIWRPTEQRWDHILSVVCQKG